MLPGPTLLEAPMRTEGATKVVDVSSAVIVLAWDRTDWFVLTSYPEER